MLTRLHFDDGLQAIESVQDVSDVLDANMSERAEKQTSDFSRKAATVPVVIEMRWLNEEWERGNICLKYGGKEWNELVFRKLQDPEWAYLRTDCAQVQGFMGFGS